MEGYSTICDSFHDDFRIEAVGKECSALLRTQSPSTNQVSVSYRLPPHKAIVNTVVHGEERKTAQLEDFMSISITPLELNP